ncbi:MAG: acetoacetate--CoA ligase, partial [Chloroflexi bacterium]
MGTASGDETLLWEPSEELKQQATLTRYMQWLEREKGLYVRDQEELWHWSVSHLEDFWASIWDFFSVKASRPYTSVLADRKMPGAQWFGGAELNYAEQVFRNASVGYPALLFQSERHPLRAVSWEELSRNVGSVANALRALGVKPGDRVVSYMANLPETVIAFLACASIGAVWSSCPPDFGTSSVIERFQQIEPKVLFAVDGYQYNGKEFDRRSVLSELQQALPTLHTTVLLPYLSKDTDTEGETSMVLWHDFLSSDTTLTFEQVPFEHPLWVLYSSGTTGLPKAIVQGHGGIVLEHLKSVGLSLDLKPGDIFFWYTTTGWMMWNILVGGLLVGTTILLYDGSPAYPTLNMLWKLAQESGMTFFGTSAGYITS